MKKILWIALAALLTASAVVAGTGGDRFCSLYIYSDTTAKNGTQLDNYTATYLGTVPAGAGVRGSRGSYNLAPWDTVITVPFPILGVNAANAVFTALVGTASDTVGLKLVKMQVSENKTNWVDIGITAATTGIWQVNTTGIGGPMLAGVQTGWVAGIVTGSPGTGLPPSPWYWCRLMIATRGINTGFNVKFSTIKDSNQ